MPYFVGQNVRLGVAINGETSGETFGGTPGDYDVMKLATGGGFKYEESNAKQYVEEVDVDPRDIVTGGIYYTVSFDVVLSYSYREKIIQLLMGGDITTSGTDPYAHEPAMADKVLFGALKLQYTDQAANSSEIIQELFTDFAVTSISISESPEGYATMSVSGIATAMTRTTDESSLATIQDTEVVSWSHLTPSLDGTSTYHLADIGIEAAQELTEGDFDHAATTPTTLDFVGRSGMRTIKWNFGIRMDSSAYTLLTDIDAVWDSANSLTWNNGGAAAAEREIAITFGDSYMESRPRTIGAWGRETAEVPMMVVDGGTAALDVVIKNARTTIPA